MLDDIWDAICDGFSYVISFEWLGDIAEFFSSMFENMGEFSITGLIFGIIGAGVIFGFEQTPYGTISIFTKGMSTFQGIFWTVATYIGCFAGGYFVGKHFENT